MKVEISDADMKACFERIVQVFRAWEAALAARNEAIPQIPDAKRLVHDLALMMAAQISAAKQFRGQIDERAEDRYARAVDESGISDADKKAIKDRYHQIR